MVLVSPLCWYERQGVHAGWLCCSLSLILGILLICDWTPLFPGRVVLDSLGSPPPPPPRLVPLLTLFGILLTHTVTVMC